MRNEGGGEKKRREGSWKTKLRLEGKGVLKSHVHSP